MKNNSMAISPKAEIDQTMDERDSPITKELENSQELKIESKEEAL